MDLKSTIQNLERAREIAFQQKAYVRYATLTVDLANAYLEDLDTDIMANQERALDIVDEAFSFYSLIQVEPGTLAVKSGIHEEWAEAMLTVGKIYLQRLRGNPIENKAKAVRAFSDGIGFLNRSTSTRQSVLKAELFYQLAQTYILANNRPLEESIDRAIYYYNESLSFAPEDQLPLWAKAKVALAKAYLRKQQENSDNHIKYAINLIQEIQQKINERTLPVEWANSMSVLGDAYQKLSDIDSRNRNKHIENAHNAYSKAMGILTKQSMPYFHLTIADAISNLYLKQKQWRNAHIALEDTIETYESVYNNIPMPEARQISLFGRIGELHSYDAYCLLQMNDIASAIESLENGRTKALSETLARDFLPLDHLKPEDHNHFLRLRQQVNMLYQEALSAGMPGTRDFAVISEELSTVNSNLKRFIQVPMAFSEIRLLAQELQKPIVYVTSTNFGCVGLIVYPTQDGINSNSVISIDSFSDKNIDALLFGNERYSGYINDIIENPEVGYKNLGTYMEILSSNLMNPICVHLRRSGYTQAVLIPCRKLSLLPLTALNLNEIIWSLSPSSYALSIAFRIAKNKQGKNLLGIGNPTSFDTSTHNSKPLIFAQLELQVIEKIFKWQQKWTFYNEQAQLGKFVPRTNDASHLHFACHGLFNVDQPLKSLLEFANDEVLELRNLQSGDIKFPSARLAVLSACQTGINDFDKVPDEAFGFPSAFIRSGVPGVISTLWSVHDLSSLLIVTKFYEYLLKGTESAEQALQHAQIWLKNATYKDIDEYLRQLENLGIKEIRSVRKELNFSFWWNLSPRRHKKPFEHPYFWAAFTFTGIYK